MKTIIKTSLKNNETIQVKETVLQVHETLKQKEAYVLLNRIAHTSAGPISIKKTTIKLVLQRP